MQTEKPKEKTDDLAQLEILLEKIMELVEKGDLQLKAADALKIIELRRKIRAEETNPKEKAQKMFFEMLQRAGKPSKENRHEN